jgi:hypothetical protein
VISERPDLTIVVCSCDAYFDLWRPFFTLFFRHWPDCPWKVALMSNEVRFDHPLVETATVGHLGSWSAELRAVLKRVPSCYVLLMLDDFFLRKAVNQTQMESCFQKLVERDGNMLRLHPRPGPDVRLAGEGLLGVVAKGAPYRVSAQSAIWRKSALESLLVDGESIWEFEGFGSRRSDALDGFYAVWHTVMPYWHHVVERGKWFRWEAKRFSRMNIGCDFSRRAVLTRPQQLRWFMKKGIGLAYDAVPWKWRRRFRWLRVLFQSKPSLPENPPMSSSPLK